MKSATFPTFLPLLVTFILTITTTLTPGAMAAYSRLMMSDEGRVHSVQCEPCDPGRCPQLSYCEGTPIKDSCNCCTVCSSSKYQPHVSLVGDDECSKVSCPKFKVCVVNLQGLPLCKCPSEFICRSGRKRKRNVCGMDGHTYPSKCHMRIASCKQGMMVRKKHRGECTPKDVREGEIHKKKMKRKMRRRQRKQQRQAKEKKKKAADRAAASGDDIIKEGGVTTNDGSGADGGNNQDGFSSAFGTDQGVFGSGAQGGGRLAERFDGGLISDGTESDAAGRETGDDEASSERKRRRKRKKRKQRKSRKGGKREKKERRRRRKKRQHRPKSRSKRHRIIYPRLRNNDAASRKRAFAEAFGHETWWA